MKNGNHGKPLTLIFKVKTRSKNDELVKIKRIRLEIKSKKIKSAAVDVIQGEQKSDLSNNKLVQYSKINNNLIITPHMAGLTYESEKLAANITFQNLNKFFKERNKL